MEGGRIRLRSEEDDLELEILEETVVQGVTYILVTDAKEGEDYGYFCRTLIRRRYYHRTIIPGYSNKFKSVDKR